MENLLTYYYNLLDVSKIDNNIFIDKNDNCYLICNKKDNISEEYVINLLKKIKSPNNYYILLKNRNGKYLTIYNDNEYFVFLTKGILNENVDLKEIVYNTLKYRYLDDHIMIDLLELWSKKIDYLEYQISELSKNKNEIINIFNFYVGLAENAISFLNINNINYNNCHKSLSHRRIKIIEKEIYYYNPINVLIDYDIRDYAEYIKSKIFNDEDVTNDLKYIINNANLSEDDIKLLYARIMYPTIFFDVIEDILIDGSDEKNIEIFINNLDNYLLTLKDIYYEINKKIPIIIPDWIKKVS